MAKKDQSVLMLLTLLPWYFSLIASAVVYIALTYIFPALPFENIILKSFINAGILMAPFFALIFLMPIPFSAFNSWRKSKQYDSCNDISDVKMLDWQRFEELVAESYRRQGYFVLENFDRGPDGGVDIRLRKNGQLHLVQCKHWKTRKVGVSVVREMYGVMIAEIAAKVIIVTSGNFTQDAKAFAFGKSIELIDGKQLENLIQDVPLPDAELPLDEIISTTTACPRCGDSLVKRKARKGNNIGKEFYGCNSFPKCRYTQGCL